MIHTPMQPLYVRMISWATIASLIHAFQESRNTSGPTSYQQLVNQNNEHGDFADEFKATRNPNSEIKLGAITSTDNLNSPASDTFLANDANANTPKMGYDLQSSPIRGSNLSAISLGRSSSENPRISNASLSTKAKLSFNFVQENLRHERICA